MVNETILKSIKKMLGVGENDTDFDYDILFSINTLFPTLNQLGALTEFFNAEELSEWEEIPCNSNDLPLIKQYIMLKTKMLFDPPDSSYAQDAINRMISEDEWRLNVMYENRNVGESVNV